MTDKAKITVSEFLSAFFREDEAVSLVAFKPRHAPDRLDNSARSWKKTVRQIASEGALQRDLLAANKTRGVYFVVNYGGSKIDEISRYNAFFSESDVESIEEQNAKLDSAPLRPSIRIETLKSVHAYWLINGECSREEWEEIQVRLAAYFRGDNSLKEPNQCMRLPNFQHVNYNGADSPLSYKKVALTDFEPERRYKVGDMLAAFPATKKGEEQKGKSGMKLRAVTSNSEFATNEERHSELVRRIIAHPTTTLNDRGKFDCRGVCHRGAGNTAILFDPATGAVFCNKGCDYFDILRAFNLPDAHLPSSTSSNSHEYGERAAFPTLNPKALYGLAGDFVRVVMPHTESDEAALIVQLLTAVGNVVGRTAYYVADGARHYTNLYTLLVGKTGAAKGSALAHVMNLAEQLDAVWAEKRIQGGLSSGEGLIKAVDDADNPTDKRLLVLETEFASVLHMNKRDSNTLSAVMRNLWDKGTSATMTKNNSVSTRNAHVSIIGHITPDELERYMTPTEIANGYANRFLFACVRRSKDLPEGGTLNWMELERLKERFTDVINFAQAVEEMKRDEEAAGLWARVYPKLAEDRQGKFGKVTARARPQVLRLSCIYALLDCSEMVRRVHLEAALAVWDFCEASALFTFGGSVLSDKAQKLFDAITGAGVSGMNKTEMFKLFGGRVKKAELNSMLEEIAATGKAYPKTSKTEGRDEERWFAVSEETIEQEFDEFDEVRALPLPTDSSSSNSSDSQNPESNLVQLATDSSESIRTHGGRVDNLFTQEDDTLAA